MKKFRRSKETKSNIIYVTPGMKSSDQNAKPNQMSNQPNGSPKKRKPNLRTLFLVIFSVWALYTFFFVLMPNKVRLNHEKQQLEQQYAELKQQEQQLSAQLNNLQDDSYIARQARKLYKMIFPGEILYHQGE